MKKLFLPFLLLAVIFTFQVTLASSDIGLKSIGPRVGFVDPEGGFDGAVLFGVDFGLGTFVDQLYWDASVEYWNSSRSWTYFGSKAEADLSDFAIRTGVLYHFVKGEWEPYAGGGIGLNFVGYDYTYNGGGVYALADADDSDFGLYIQGGIEHKFNEKWAGDANIRLDFGDADQTAFFLTAKYMLGH